MAVAIQHLPLSTLLAWALLTGACVMGQAITRSESCEAQLCKCMTNKLPDQQQESWVPLILAVGACCGLVWCLMFLINDSQTGDQQGLLHLPKCEVAKARCNLSEQPVSAGGWALDKGLQ